MQRATQKQATVGGSFLELFRRWAGRIRRLLLGRALLTGLGLGLTAAALLALGLWRAGVAGRPWAAGAAALVGLVAALVVARRRRWSDQDVALYLDGRLGSDEVVTTALGLGGEGAGETHAVVLGRAEKALGSAHPRRLRPRFWSAPHLLAPAGAAALAYALYLPPRVAAQPAAPPGLDRVTLADVRGLERLAELGSLAARDDEQRRRLDAIARDAKALREKLSKGVEKREAQAEIARMRDALRSERMSLGDGERRAGLEGALDQLSREPLTSSAAKALADGDLVRFDDAMQELANRREQSDRDRAKKALEEAAEAAKKAGASDVAKALNDQKKLLGERGERADELRALGEALGEGLTDEERQALSEFGRAPSDANARKLAESMQKALERLTPEERKRLAERLKKRMAQGQMGRPGSSSREQMRDLAEKLGTEEGRKKLEDELRELANEDTDDDEAERQRRLDEAERGLGEGNGAEGQPGAGSGSEGRPGAPVPLPGAGQGGPGGKGGKGGKGDGQGGPGEGGGPGDHAGESKKVDAAELRARAAGRWRGGAPPGGISVGRAAGRAGETANVQGSGALGTVGPGEVHGVDRAAVPEEYREQVGRYFQP
jgi:hypothetical protein